MGDWNKYVLVILLGLLFVKTTSLLQYEKAYLRHVDQTTMMLKYKKNYCFNAFGLISCIVFI